MPQMPMQEFVLACIVVLTAGSLVAYLYRPHRIGHINVIAVLFVTHLLCTLAPSLMFLFDPTMPVASHFFVGACLATLLIPIGAMIADTVYRLNASKVEGFLQGPFIEDSDTIRQVKNFTYLLFGVCVCNLLYVMRSSPTYPLKELLLGAAASDFHQSRYDTSHQASLIVRLFQLFVMPMLFIISAFSWKYYKSLTGKLFVIACMGVAFLNNSYAGRKTPIALFFMLTFFYWFFLPRKKGAGIFVRSNLVPLAAIGGAMAYPFMIFMFLPVGQNLTLFAVLTDAIIGRILYNPAFNTYAAFQLFPQYFPFTDFTDVNLLASVFGFQSFELSTAVAYAAHGTDAHAPPPTLGTFYAEGGWLGILIGIPFASFFFRMSETFFLGAVKKTRVTAAFYALMLYGGFRFSWGDFPSVVVYEVIFPVFLMLGFCLFLFPRSVRA